MVVESRVLLVRGGEWRVGMGDGKGFFWFEVEGGGWMVGDVGVGGLDGWMGGGGEDDGEEEEGAQNCTRS